VVATVAFGLFGLHGWALTVLMLALMALSAVTFVWRFPNAVYGGVVVLYFATLTGMLFTSLVWDPSYEVNIPVGGIRYFSLVTVLPIFHILLELLHAHPVQTAPAKRNRVLLGTQTAILVLGILVRGSALPLIGGITLVCLVLAWRARRDGARRQMLAGNAKVMVLVSVALLAAIALLVPPNYLTEGRFGTVIWQRVTQSLGVSPAWLFPGVSDMFDCKKYVPAGLETGLSDNNGACIWFDYITKHNIPIETIGDKTFGGLYETAMREAFFKIAAHYPGEVLKTFIFYKPQMIVQAIQRSLVVNLNGDQTRAIYPGGPPVVPYPPLALTLLALSFGVVLVFFTVEIIPVRDLWHVAGVTMLSALFTIPSYLAAWAMVHTSADLLFYCLFGIGLALGAGLTFVRAVLRRLTSSPMKA
jgi:hypothetical protein